MYIYSSHFIFNFIDSTAVKKMKVSEEDICWEWENDGNMWSKFSSTLNDELTSAFKSGLKNIKVMINEAKFDIVFERMVQRNLKTFWERRIRANVDSGDGGLSGLPFLETSVFLPFCGLPDVYATKW